MIENPTLDTDAYKITHWKQRPENLTKFYSYGEARKGGEHDRIVFFGLQYMLQQYFLTPVFSEDIDEGIKLCKSIFGTSNYYPEEIWRKVHQLGYFPLEIKAVEEGSVVETGNVCFTIESTEDWFAPMVSHFEDYLMWVWYTTAVATRGYFIKKSLEKIFRHASDNQDLSYVVNDFGLRGAAGREAAILGGMAHLVNFNGTDNIPAIRGVKENYINAIGGSVWATEHSVATVWGKDQEKEYVLAQLERAGNAATVSIVIDSYDSDNFVNNIIGDPEVVEVIKNRSGRTVIRPDSGDPLENVLYYSDVLSKIFGYHLNSKGFYIIDHNVGIIQGDGMTEQSIPNLFKEYVKEGWSPENVIVGSGGGLLTEGLTRDTDRWAIKCSYAEINSKSIDVRKTPKTDMTKQSKAGKLALVLKNGTYRTILEDELEYPEQNCLRTVFKNGKLYNYSSFDQIRKNVF